MTWTMVGWIIIGLAAVLLAALTWIVKPRALALRRQDFFRHLNRSRTATLEQGRRQEVVLGHALWSRAYPGLGLSGLASYDALLDAETLADGRQTVSANAGILAVFARQIIRGRYDSGFSDQLLPAEIQPVVYGPTTFSFNAGLMSDLKMQDYGTLVILGDFGPESAISVKNIHDQRGQAFAAAGSLASQAALLLNVQNILLGEEVFMAPALLDPQPKNLAGAQAEDWLRIGLILALVIGATLKAVGVL
ncbi:MAG: hypothetical protein H0S79_19220 [Anaerolineaceae bacterium]|nr:hypothetical protein [Anaerolineaceae bacterium]